MSSPLSALWARHNSIVIDKNNTTLRSFVPMAKVLQSYGENEVFRVPCVITQCRPQKIRFHHILQRRNYPGDASCEKSGG